MMPKLTICIASLHTRSKLLARILGQLSSQPRSDQVEILVEIDNSQSTIGQKRNRLINRARGQYIAHVDDDDEVSPLYLERILGAIDTWAPTVDAITIRGERTDAQGKHSLTVFGYRLMRGDRAEMANGVLWRSPGHLCPIRRDLVLKVPFPEVEPEDLVWTEQMSQLIGSVVAASPAEETLYFYRWDSAKVNRWQQKTT